MGAETIVKAAILEDSEWMPFPGGELEGARPKTLCQACREALRTAASSSRPWRFRHRPAARSAKGALCFQCYRAELDRVRRLRAAGDFDAASEARFQSSLPFEPVNRVKLEMLKVERLRARNTARTGIGQFADRRRRAQIAARHALQRIAAGLQEHKVGRAETARVMAAAAHAAELQLPETWLPFVVSR
jgi:hypothetical protein